MTSDAPLILLAEDNLSIAKATVNYLRAFNFDVISVANGRSAIETAKQQSPDLILMDIQMPEVDGLEAIRQIRKIPDHRETPIIALTGLAMRDDANKCIANGATSYISKPYSMKQLVRLMQELLPTPA